MPLTAATIYLLFFLLWLLSLARRDASLVDVAWGPAFLVATIAAAAQGPLGPRAWLTLAVVAIWGLRLGLHIGLRNRGHGEDPRYRAMRAKHGAAFWWRSAFTVFALQASLLLVISAPLQVAVSSAAPLGWLDALAAGIWAVGLYWEAVADAQLRRFKATRVDPQAILDTGLWAWSRHPNYFGEMVLWWGLYGIACAAGGAWTLFSPLLMAFLLMRVSGVPLLEASLSARPAYRDYVARTPAFFPRRPGSSK